MTDDQIEQEIQEKGLCAPRVTMDAIEDAIVAEYCFVAGSALSGTPVVDSLNRLTFCIVVLRNGYTVTGESACVSPENFDAEIGRKIARQNAIDKCWPLFGFALAQELSGARVLVSYEDS